MSTRGRRLARLLAGATIALGCVVAPAVDLASAAASVPAPASAPVHATSATTDEVAAPGTLKVQLVTPTGSPWKRKNVHLIDHFNSAAPYYQIVTTNSSGLATFTGVPSTEPIRIQAMTWYAEFAYTSTTMENIFVPAGGTATVDLVIAKGATISGRVKTAHGVLKNAQVVAVDSSGAATQAGTTNSHGQYRIIGLKTGTYAIQFNGRSWADSKLAVVATYGWNYLGGTSLTLANSHTVSVRQQGAKTKPTATTNINGRVAAGPRVIFALADAAPGGQLNIEKIVNGNVVSAETVYSPIYAPGTRNGVRLNAGDYRITVQYREGSDLIQYFYTGAGSPLSKVQGDAQLLTVGATGLTVNVGSRP